MSRLMVFLLCVLSTLVFPRVPSAQESCVDPIVIINGWGGELTTDLSTYSNDLDGCGGPQPGPDLVFFADGSGVDLVFRITNQGPSTVTLTVDFTFWCHPDSFCNASFTVPMVPGRPITWAPTISQPIYVIVQGPPSSQGALPFRFNYSLGSATPTSEVTWGEIKTYYQW